MSPTDSTPNAGGLGNAPAPQGMTWRELQQTAQPTAQAGRPIDQLREKYPQLRDQPDSKIVELVSAYRGSSPAAAAWELGIQDVGEYKSNTGFIGDTIDDLEMMAPTTLEAVVGIADLANPATYLSDSNMSTALDQFYDWTGINDWRDKQRLLQSPQLREARAAQAQAREEGLGAYIGSLVANPRATISGTVQSLPLMAAGAGVGKLAQIGTRGVTSGMTAGRVSGVTAQNAVQKFAPAVQEAVDRAYPFIGEGAIIAGSQMNTLVEEGVDPGKAAAIAFGTGVAGGAIGMGVANQAARRFGLGDPNALIAGQRLASDVKAPRMRYRIPGTAALEGLQEGLQAPIEQAGQNLGTGDPLLEGTAYASAQGVASGAPLGAVVGVFPGTRPTQPPLTENEPFDAIQAANENAGLGVYSPEAYAGATGLQSVNIPQPPSAEASYPASSPTDLVAAPASSVPGPTPTRENEPVVGQGQTDFERKQANEVRARLGLSPLPEIEQAPLPSGSISNPTPTQENEPVTGQAQTDFERNQAQELRARLGLAPSPAQAQSPSPDTPQPVVLTDVAVTSSPEGENNAERDNETGSIQATDTSIDPERASVQAEPDLTEAVWLDVFRGRRKSRRHQVEAAFKKLKNAVTTLNPQSEDELRTLAGELDTWVEDSGKAALPAPVAEAFLRVSGLGEKIDALPQQEPNPVDAASERISQADEPSMDINALEAELNGGDTPQAPAKAETEAEAQPDTAAAPRSFEDRLYEGAERVLVDSGIAKRIDRAAQSKKKARKAKNLFINWQLAKQGGAGNYDGPQQRQWGTGGDKLAEALAPYFKKARSGSWASEMTQRFNQGVQADAEMRDLYAEIPTSADEPATSEVAELMVSSGAETGSEGATVEGLRVSNNTGADGVAATELDQASVDEWAALADVDAAEAREELASLPEVDKAAWVSTVEFASSRSMSTEQKAELLEYMYEDMRSNVGANVKAMRLEGATEKVGGGGAETPAQREQRARNEAATALNNLAKDFYTEVTATVPEAPDWGSLPDEAIAAFVEDARVLQELPVSDRLKRKQARANQLREFYDAEAAAAENRKRGDNPQTYNPRSSARGAEGGTQGAQPRDGKENRSEREPAGVSESGGADAGRPSGRNEKAGVGEEVDGTPAPRTSRARVGAPIIPSTKAKIDQTIQKLFGDLPNFERFRPQVYATAAEAEAARQEDLGQDRSQAVDPIGEGTVAWVETFTDGTQKAYFVAEMIPAGREMGVVMHEMGVHMGIDALEDASRVELARIIADFAQRDDGSVESELAKGAIRQMQRAQKMGDTADEFTMTSETIAYFVDGAVETGFTPDVVAEGSPLRQFWDRIMEMFAAAFERVFGGMPEDVTAQDIVDLAYGASRANLTKMARPDGPTGRVEATDFKASPSVPGISYARATGIKKTLGNTVSNNVEKLPEGLREGVATIYESIGAAKDRGLYRLTFMRDLAARAANEFNMPTVPKLFDLTLRIAAKRHRDNQVADEIGERFASLPNAVKLSLMKYVDDSTLEQKWGYKPEWRDDAVVDPDMAKRFNGLSADAQQIVKDMNKYFDDTQARKKQVMDDLINADYDKKVLAAEGSETQIAKIEKGRATALAKNANTFKPMKGPYNPRKRFGNFVVKGTSTEYDQAVKDKDWKKASKLQRDPKHYEISFAESRRDARKKFADMKTRFANADYFQKMEAYKRMGDDLQAFEKLRSALRSEFDGLDTPDAQRERDVAKDRQRLEGILDNLLLQSLSEQSAREAQNRRKNIAGVDPAEAMRSFLTQAHADNLWLSNLTSTGEINKLLEKIREEADTQDEVGRDEKRRLYSVIFNKVMARSNEDETGTMAVLQNKLAGLGSMYYLLLSPGYYAQNAMQPQMMTVPLLATDYGYRTAQKYLYDGYSGLKPLFKGSKFTQRFDLNKLPEELRGVVQELEDRNLIHSTITADLGSLTEVGTTGGVSGSLRKLDETIRLMPAKLEQINRISGAIAAYKLARKEGNKSYEQAVDYAAKIVYESNGDYSEANAPAWLSVAQNRLPVRALFQFRKFQVIQVSYIARMLNQIYHNSNEGDRAAGLRAVMFALSHAAIATGAKGLPAIGTAGMLASWVMGGDDEPAQIERWAREGLSNAGLPPTAIGIIMNGVAEPWFGSTATSKLGYANMLRLFPFTDINFQDSKGYGQLLVAAAGPTLGGVPDRAWKGFGQIERGNYYEGLEQLIPKGIRDAMSAWRYKTEGVTTRGGNQLMSPEDISGLEALAVGLGLPPKVITDRWALSSQLYEAQNFFRERSSEIRQQYRDAIEGRGSTTEARREWRRMNESRRELGFSTLPMSSLMSVRRQDREALDNAVMGVSTNAGNRSFVERAARTYGY